jgi:hypothetical protein
MQTLKSLCRIKGVIVRCVYGYYEIIFVLAEATLYFFMLKVERAE